MWDNLWRWSWMLEKESHITSHSRQEKIGSEENPLGSISTIYSRPEIVLLIWFVSNKVEIVYSIPTRGFLLSFILCLSKWSWKAALPQANTEEEPTGFHLPMLSMMPCSGVITFLEICKLYLNKEGKICLQTKKNNVSLCTTHSQVCRHLYV